MSINKKEVSNLVEYFKDYYKLSNCNDFNEELIASINNQLSDKKTEEQVKKSIAKSFIEKSRFNTENDILNLQKIYSNFLFLIKYKEDIKEINELYSENYSSIKLYYNALKNYNDKFIHLFMSKDEKTKVEKGICYLSELKEKGIWEKIENFNKLNPNNFSSEEILDSFNNTSEEYRLIFYSIFKQNPVTLTLFHIQDDVRKAKEVTTLNLNKERFDLEVNSYNDIICKNALKITTIDKYEQIEKMPIEELNRNGNGFKINLLRTNGFKTIADIWRAPEAAISNIKGISQANAYSIKQKTNELFNSLGDEKKEFKIDYDNKDSKQTELIKSIFGLKSILSLKDNLDFSFDISKINKDIEILEEFKNDFSWIFFNDKEKENIYNAYKEIKEFLKDSYYLNCEKFLKYSSLNYNSFDEEMVWNDFKINNIFYYNVLKKLMPSLFNQDKTYGHTLEFSKLIENECFYPKGLTCDLRNYQEYGVKYILHQKRVLLGDEMGLGKTVQAIAAMVSLKNIGYDYFVVVCPASVMENWFREVRNKSKLQSFKVHGPMRYKLFNAWKENGGVLITTYETVQKLSIDNFDKIGLITVDEAHFIKNPQAKRSKFLYDICNKVERTLFMSGTPLENRVDEMLQLISVLNYKTFTNAKLYANLVQSKSFREAIQDVYFRRKQKDVLNELPEKIETVIWCKMEKEETQKYENLLLNTSYSFMPSRQISFQYNSTGKINALKDIVDDLIKENRKMVIFSFFKTSINKIHELFADISVPPIDGSLKPEQRQEIIDMFANDNSKFILPAQIQAGGVGLNMQMASAVIILEPQVKPSIENQAIARVHRMGQAQKTLVFKLCNEENIDERLMEQLEEKQRQFDVFADKSVSGLKSLELSDSEISNLINKEIERIKNKKSVTEEINPGFDIENAAVYEVPDYYKENCQQLSTANKPVYKYIGGINSKIDVLNYESRKEILNKDNIELSYDTVWFRFRKNKAEINSDKCGKWMCFYNNSIGAEKMDEILYKICSTAIKDNVCKSCKYQSTYTSIDGTGVACFYTEIDNLEEHKQIINFFIKNHLLKRTQSGKYANISFKLDNQTRNDEYGTNFVAKLRLSDIMNLETGKFLDEPDSGVMDDLI